MSTAWYAPNQQAVRADGSGPAEEGDGGTPSTEPQPEPPPDSQPPIIGTPADFDAMTKDELLDYADKQGVDVDVSMTKAQIREAIGA